MLKNETKDVLENVIDRIEPQNKKNNSRGIKKKKEGLWKRVIIVLLTLFIIGMSIVGFLLYGPYQGFRNWLVTTAMTTMTHQYFATWFYDDDTIQEILDQNKVVDIDENTDESVINVAAAEE